MKIVLIIIISNDLPIWGHIEPLQLPQVGYQAVDIVDKVVVEAEHAQLGEAGEGADFGVGNLRVVHG